MERPSKDNWALPEGKKLRLSPDELCLLGVCMGYVSVPDLGAELPGFSKEHMGIVLPSMVKDLQQRGVLKETFGHAPRVQEGYRKSVSAVFDPEALVDLSASWKEGLRCFFKGDTCMAIDRSGVLYAFEGRQALCRALCREIPMKEETALQFSLPLERAEEVKTLYNTFRRGEAEEVLHTFLTMEESNLWLTLLSGTCPRLEISLWSHESSSYRMEASGRFVFMEEGIFQIGVQEGHIHLRSVSGEALQKTIEGYCQKQEVTHG